MKDKVGFYVFIIVFAGVFLALGAALSVDLVRDVRHGEASLRWPTTTGKVIGVFRSRDRPALAYQYVVEGQTYARHRVVFVRRQTLERGRGLETYYGRDFSEGETVEVRYDPADPGTSVLIPGAPVSGVVVGGVVIGFLFLVGVGVLGLGFMRPPGG